MQKLLTHRNNIDLFVKPKKENTNKTKQMKYLQLISNSFSKTMRFLNTSNAHMRFSKLEMM